MLVFSNREDLNAINDKRMQLHEAWTLIDKVENKQQIYTEMADE